MPSGWINNNDYSNALWPTGFADSPVDLIDKAGLDNGVAIDSQPRPTWNDIDDNAAPMAQWGFNSELYDMGFDEVALADVMHPVVEGMQVQNAEGEMEQSPFLYTREMSTEPDPVTAICGFAVYVADQLKDRSGLLSIYVDSPQALVRNNELSGQNAVLFMKIYDRVYYRTDRYTYTYNLQDMEGSVPYGDVHDRFVPVVINLIPHDNSSWVYIEQLAEEQA